MIQEVSILSFMHSLDVSQISHHNFNINIGIFPERLLLSR